MDISEKVMRLLELGEKAERLKVILNVLTELQRNAINAETYNRCYMLIRRLSEQVDPIWQEFNILERDVEEFQRENGL